MFHHSVCTVISLLDSACSHSPASGLYLYSIHVILTEPDLFKEHESHDSDILTVNPICSWVRTELFSELTEVFDDLHFVEPVPKFKPHLTSPVSITSTLLASAVSHGVVIAQPHYVTLTDYQS
jgi:hypothetical protein